MSRWARPMRRWIHRATPTPSRAVRNGLVAMAMCWQALVVLGLRDELVGPRSAGWTQVACAGIAVTWLVMVGCSLVPSVPPRLNRNFQVANCLLLLVTGIGLLMGTTGRAGSDASWASGATLVNVGVGVTALLLPGRLVRVLLICAVVAESMSVAVTWYPGSPLALLADALLYPLNALAVGLAAWGARTSLMRKARGHESAWAALHEEVAKTAALARARATLARQQRRIHETVLNTLTAIAQGGLADNPSAIDRLRAAALESAIVLESPWDSSEDPRESTRDWVADLQGLASRLQAAGIDTRIAVTATTRLPQDAYRGILTAIREALLNIERHARAHQALVRIEDRMGQGRRPTLIATVTDDGRGFDVASTDMGLGLRGSITEALSEVGGQATIASRPGAGTEVVLTWPVGADQRPPDAASEPFPASNVDFARPVLGWFGTFVLASAACTMPLVPRPLFSLLSLALVVGMGWVLWRLSARAWLPGWVVLGAAALAPLAYALQQQALGEAVVSHWEDWPSSAVAAIWVVIVGSGPWWSAVVAVVSWLFTQGDPSHELLQPGTAVILAVAIFARSVRFHAKAADRLARERMDKEVTLLAEAQSVDRLALRQDLMQQCEAARTLRGIAAGTLDPADRQVRQACAAEERYLRAILRLDPDADPVHRRAVVSMLEAYRRGLPIDVDLSGTLDIPELAADRFFDDVDQVIATAQPLLPARLSARREGGAVILRFVTEGGEVVEARHG